MAVRYGCITCRRPVESDTVIYECPRCAAQNISVRPDWGYPRGYLSVIYSPALRVRRGDLVDPLGMLPIPVTGAGAFTAWALWKERSSEAAS